jgi:hypothetical protein
MWKVSSCDTEGDETEQAASLPFLKFLDSLQVNKYTRCR